MSPRERMHAALSGAAVDVFPVAVPYVGILLRDHWREVTRVPWWAVRADDVEASLQVTADLQQQLAIDWVETGLGPSRAWRERHRVELRAGQPFLVDQATGESERLAEPPVGGEQAVVSTARVRSLAEVEQAVPITPAEELLADGCFDLARAEVERFGHELFMLASIGTPFWSLYDHFGFYRMMANLVEQPGLAECLLERLARHHLELLRAYAAVGIDGVWVEDCYSSADLISPAQFRRFAAPYARRLVAEIRRLGMKSIYYFCGDVSDRLEDLVAMRPHALALEESKKGFVVDLAKVDEIAAGRTCLFGNLDAIRLLEKGDRAALAAEVARQSAVGRRRGRFVHSLGSPVTPRTSLDRVREWIELARGGFEQGDRR